MKCKKCGVTFDTKYNFNRHLNRKTPCEPVINTTFKSGSQCQYCYRIMSSTHSLKRHYRTCRAYIEHIVNNNEDDDTILNIDKNLLTFNCKNIQVLVEKIIDLNGKNSTYALHIRMTLMSLIESGNCINFLKQLLTYIHDNDEYPEGKNIFISSSGRRLITFYNDRWVQTSIDQIVIMAANEALTIIPMLENLNFEHRNVIKCIRLLTNVKIKFQGYVDLLKHIGDFGLSKNNPDVEVVSGMELKKPINVESDEIIYLDD